MTGSVHAVDTVDIAAPTMSVSHVDTRRMRHPLTSVHQLVQSTAFCWTRERW